jgi:osmotically-inducible protein OsmY
VNQGVVTLTGTVSSLEAKRAADDDAWDTPGVREVHNDLIVVSSV